MQLQNVVIYEYCLPVVASPVGMNADVFRRGLIGYPAMTSDEWYDALTAIYNDTDLARTMGENGRQVVIEYYSPSMISAKIASIFQSLS